MYSKRKRTSPVWTYMEQTGSNIVTCTICKGTFTFTGSTSGLFGHLRTRHRTEYLDLTNIETPNWPPPLASSQSAESASPSLSGPSQPGPSQPGPSQPGPSQPGPSQPGPSSRVISAAPRKLSRQQTLEYVFTRRQAYPDGSEKKKKKNDSHLLKMIVSDMQPLSLVENKGFQEFVKVIDPRYVLPSRRELMRTQFPSLYEKQKQQMREELEGLLATKRLMVDHTSENIEGALKEICEEWDLLEKVCCIVTDNAPNIVKAVKDMNVIHIPCFAHSLNLVVQNALKNSNDVKKVQEKVKAIVSFFHHSVKSSDKFQEQHEAVTSTLCVLGRNNMCLSGDELECLSKAICVLQPFDVVTKELSAEKITCLSKVIPLIKALRSCMFSKKDAHRREFYETFPLGLEVRARLDRKFSGLERRFILAVGTLLDPRLKKLHFVDKGNINDVQEKLINSMCARSDSQEPVPAPATPSSSTSETNTTRKTARLEKAKHYLCIPATSVSSERVFSRAGELISD
ncbi:E3 SUMO-protein ligase ZBED1-like [Oratosquilla oratoria]|uniref:E3 SUMO-protein ligase ZBED1-like n=1 Tax=Oratosquilla oratoria TaxID=337810 RepID=UPI003F760AF0